MYNDLFDNSLYDNNKMNLEIYLVLIFKATKLIIKTMIVCYIIGILWYILVQLNENRL